MNYDKTNLADQTHVVPPFIGMDGDSAAETTGLDQVSSLFNALNQAEVSYCHWKSNVRLAKAMMGKTDLDLLVDERDIDAFRRILAKFHLKPLNPAPGKEYPGIEDYLGFDPTSGDLFHLHVHYQLVFGEQHVKNYRLPIENYFLSEVRLQCGVRVPIPELELILFCLRALLKYRDRDGVKDIFSIRSSGLPYHVISELEWLLSQTSIDRVSETLQVLGRQLPAEVVIDFLRVVKNNPRDGIRLLHLRTRLRRALRPFQRHSRFRATLIYFRELWRRWDRVGHTYAGRKKRLAGCNPSIAVVGADGAGKSSMSKLLQRWLAWKLDVRRFYLGSKQPSLMSDLLYLLFRVSRRIHRTTRRYLGINSLGSRGLALVRQFLIYSHHISIGYDRLRRLAVSQDKSSIGLLVIYDRFPLAPSLDGPKIKLLASGSFPRLTKVFSRWEEGIYRQFAPPDYYFVLDVSPEVAWNRKPDHSRSAIEAKYHVLQELIRVHTGSSEMIVLDADQPFEAVERDLKQAVWQVL